MPHFVTSAQGKAHVTSANAAHWNAGTLGDGCYVLPLGSKLACSMTDSNTLRVLFGVASVCGRQWEIEGDYEEVNIDNGTPGVNRCDLLVCRIETAPQETIALKVYKGEETAGTPVAPSHVEGDLNAGDTVCEMPICSVAVQGINPQEPVSLVEESRSVAEVLAELAELRAELARCPFPVGALYLSFSNTSPAKLWPGTTWQQQTGRFVRMANDTGTGGADTVALTAAQMPNHTHDLWYKTAWGSGSGGATGYYQYSTFTSLGSSWNATTNAAGSGQPHNNMPSYQDVYAWRRLS